MGDFTSHSGGRHTVFIDDRLTDQAADVVREVEDLPGMTISLDLPTGRRIKLPDELATLLFDIVADVSHGQSVAVRSMPESLTTSVAAGELGISRPTLMKLIGSGEIPTHKVGSHTRLKRADLDAYQARRELRIRGAADSVFSIEDSALGS